MLASSMNAGKRDNVLCIFSEIFKGVINVKNPCCRIGKPLVLLK